VTDKFKSSLKIVLKLSFSAGLLYWLVTTGKLDINDLKSLLDPALLFWGILWIGLTLCIASERWHFLLISQGIPAGRFDCFRLTLVGLFFSFFLPGGVGGDVIKAYYVVQRLESKKSHAIGSVLFDRFIGLFSMTIFCLFAVFFSQHNLMDNPKIRPLFYLVSMLFLIFLSLFLALWSRRFHKLRNFILEIFGKIPFAQRNLGRLLSFQLTRSQFLKVVFISLATQTCNFIFFFGLPRFLGYPETPLLPLMFAVPLGFIATAIPISPGGVGVGQAAFFFLYNLVLQKDAQLGSISVTLFQAFSIAYGLLGAIFYLNLGKPKRIAVD